MVSLKFRHLGVAVSNMDKALAVYQQVFKYKLISGSFHDPIQKVTVCFVGTGDTGS